MFHKFSFKTEVEYEMFQSKVKQFNLGDELKFVWQLTHTHISNCLHHTCGNVNKFKRRKFTTIQLSQYCRGGRGVMMVEH